MENIDLLIKTLKEKEENYGNGKFLQQWQWRN